MSVFVRRREADRPVDPGAPLDTDRELVVVEENPVPYDPPRPVDTPTRPARVGIVHTGLRGTWESDPFGIHVEIERKSGRPRGRAVPQADPYVISIPEPTTWGSMYELGDATSTDDDELGRMMGL